MKQEIIELKIRLSAIEAQLKDMGAEATPSKQETDESGFPSGPYKLKGFGEEGGDFTADLVHATYTIRTAATAFRGYMMLLDQAGLSKDQKKMVRELEYGAMMAMKAMVAIQLFNTARAATGDPTAIFALIAGGGSLAASAAFGSKLQGGMV